jgi:chemotaxis family two-component system response regulator Rcp1
MDAVTPTTRPADRAQRPIEILLVEDNAADVAFTRQVLRRSSLKGNLTVARDGEEALAVLAGPGRPDLVLLDLNMPRMDGLEVLEAVKGNPDLRAIPVIVLTSSIADEDVERAYASHVNAYIRKPVGLEDLSRIIDAIDLFWCTVAVLPGLPGGAKRTPSAAPR